MNNQKEFYDEFKDLDFDLTLIKIINEDYYEKINSELIKKIISEKLIEIYFSSDQVILDLVSGKILQHLKNNSEILSYLKGTKRIINFVESIKTEMPKWKTTKSSKQLNLFESEDDKNVEDTQEKSGDDKNEKDNTKKSEDNKKSNKDISTEKFKEIKKCMDDLVDCVNYMCDIEITLGLKPLDVKIMKMKAKNLLELLDPSDPIISNLPKLDLPNEAKTINYENEGQYIGEIKNGLRHGKGKMTYDNGNIYSGDWMNDVFHGKGTYQKTNGQSSSGDWENGYLIKGRIVFMEGLLNNEEYIGELIYSFFGYPVPHGKGTYFYINGDKYVGEFVDYKKEGKGIFTWANGDSYCGQWENDEYHGEGILKKDGIIKDGYWDKGEFMGN